MKLRLLAYVVVLSCGSETKIVSEGGLPGDALPIDLGDNVLERNYHPSRDGFFVQPTLSKAKAAALARDMSFDGTIAGNVYASPLYAEGKIIIATENNQVSALDETTGKPIWQKSF